MKTQADWPRLSTGKLLKELAKCEKDLQLQVPPDVSEEQFSAFLARHARDYARAGVDIANASPLMLMVLREQAKEEQALAQIYARAGTTNPGASPLLLMALNEHGTPEQKQTHQLVTKRAAIKSELVRRERTPGRAAQPSNSTANRPNIDTFIQRVWQEEQQRITRRNIWTVAGYRNATEFERFQRNDARTTDAAKQNFRRVLAMTPSQFCRALTKKRNQLP